MFLTYLCTSLLLLTGFLLMFIVLLQRGRGGGLAGAFGGLGGQSAFGTKAGDVFTKITIIRAVSWVALAGVTGFAMKYDSEKSSFKSAKKAPKEPEITTPRGKKPKKPLFPPPPKSGKKTDTEKKSDTEKKTDSGKKTNKPADKSKQLGNATNKKGTVPKPKTEPKSVGPKFGKAKGKTPETKTKKKTGS